MEKGKGCVQVSLIRMLPAFLLAAGITALLTPVARRIALRLGLIDNPNPRRLNKVPMPTGGGIAIFVGFLLTSFVVDVPHFGITALAGLLILVVGLLDDRFELSPGIKFGCQFLAVLIYVLWGPRIEFISNPFGEMLYLGKLSLPLTMLWVLTLINIMNFIDGLDGLSVGITMISAIALATLAWSLQRYDAAMLSVIVVGVSVGFLPYNFNPAKVYLGDGGALLLGFLLAAVSTEGALKGAATIGLSVPVLILAVPVMDLLCAVVRRVQQGLPFYRADKNHFHHRLLALGLSQRQVVCLAYLLTCFSATVAVMTAHFARAPWMVALILGLVFAYGSTKVGMIQPLNIFRKEEGKDA